ncbi:hypothetical protein [Streptomyces sp. NPDC090021]
MTTIHHDGFDGSTASLEGWVLDAPPRWFTGIPGSGVSVPRATIELTL